MCGVGIGERHGHVADTQTTGCCACAVRATCCSPPTGPVAPDSAASARHAALDDLVHDEAEWDRLRIPVDLAFFFRHSDEDALLAFYPGPGGATESTLDLGSWTDMLRQPGDRRDDADIEAVLLRHLDPGFSGYVMPIDICYELVGIVREHWEGLPAATTSGSGSRRSSRGSTVAASARAGRLRCPS